MYNANDDIKRRMNEVEHGAAPGYRMTLNRRNGMTTGPAVTRFKYATCTLIFNTSYKQFTAELLKHRLPNENSEKLRHKQVILTEMAKICRYWSSYEIINY